MITGVVVEVATVVLTPFVFEPVTLVTVPVPPPEAGAHSVVPELLIVNTLFALAMVGIGTLVSTYVLTACSVVYRVFELDASVPSLLLFVLSSFRGNAVVWAATTG